ncbi:hypothetical protein [Methylophaga sp.]|uniref:hypothetical protein n=1 Tax=Methylophaga sp. TaxID=2024840 RepID=UPI003A939D39
MFNKFAKFLLVATSLSPILGAVAVTQYAMDKGLWSWLPFIIVAVLLIFICWGLLQHAKKTGQTHQFKICEFESNDQETVAFLIAYLLPFISSDNMAFNGQWLTFAYVIIIIFMVISHAGAVHFNPVMGIFFNYHFYSVKNTNGVRQLLISKKELHTPNTEVKAVKLAHNIYLEVGDKDA